MVDGLIIIIIDNIIVLGYIEAGGPQGHHGIMV